VGCTYKYLNGGPGSPAFFCVRSELQDELRSPIQGWFGQDDQFAMGPRYQRRAGIGGWLAGTPTVTALLAIDEGIAMIERAGIDAIRSKGIALTEYAVGLHDAWLAPLGFRLGSPRDASRRGSHVSVRRADARLLTEALLANGVVPDFREPDSIRIGLSPLSTRFVDVFEGIRRLRDLAANR
jgi:kynureninase